MTFQLSEAVTSESVSDEAITQTMARCWEESQYLLCPHSATAVNYHYQQTDSGQSRYQQCNLGHCGQASPPGRACKTKDSDISRCGGFCIQELELCLEEV